MTLIIYYLSCFSLGAYLSTIGYDFQTTEFWIVTSIVFTMVVTSNIGSKK